MSEFKCPFLKCPICNSENWNKDHRNDDWNCQRCGTVFQEINGETYVPELTVAFCSFVGRKSLPERAERYGFLASRGDDEAIKVQFPEMTDGWSAPDLLPEHLPVTVAAE
jgi:hypothetical protein